MSTALRPDILIESPTTGSIAIVEVKNRQGFSPAIATDLYASLSRYGYAFRAPYFLLLSQDTGFLWHALPDASGQPPQQFSMREVVARYLPNRPPADRLDEFGLSLVVVHWLNELAVGVRDADAEPERSLAGTGFLAAIHGARITVEPRL